MAQFDIYQFEDRVDDLLNAYRRLRLENDTLRHEFEALARRNTEGRRRVQALVDRLRALEMEAETQPAETQRA